MTTPVPSRAEGRPHDSPDLDTDLPTGDVGSEGGSPGDVELERTSQGTGSEADELWRPADDRSSERTVRRDETGEYANDLARRLGQRDLSRQLASILLEVRFTMDVHADDVRGDGAGRPGRP